MFDKERQAVEAKIRTYCAQNEIPLSELKWVPIPFSGEWGFSTSFFQTAANEARTGKKVAVPQRAQEIAEQVRGPVSDVPGIRRVEAVKGYLNLYFDTAEYARRVVDTVLKEDRDFGHGAPKGERVMVEYAQPNTHHSFHIGHARNAILGETLARIVQFAGFDTIRASYPGDMGLGVITVLWAYDKFYKNQQPQGIHERGQWLAKIYVEAIKLLEAKENETPEEKVQREAGESERREIYRKWDAGDPEVRNLWLETREWSLEELRDILRILDINIDVWFFESDVDGPCKAIVEELISRGIADDERPQGGAVIVKIDEKLGLTKEKYRTNVLLRSDGTSLYLTKDLALAKVKFEQYQVDRSIYVVDVRQSMHLQQAFAILKLWGFKQAEKCFHLGYGFVSLPEGAMSARRGRVVVFKDVADEAEQRALAAMGERTPEMPESERRIIAQQIGLGALKYALLSVDNNKDIVFNIDEALNFEGHTGPYIQNAYVRAASILRKSNVERQKSGAFDPSTSFVPRTPAARRCETASSGQALRPVPFDYELTTHEVQLIDLISRFPAAVEQAANE
ncbi:MAG: arginine--tRNA ligase, partial [Chloroflexi bacterium]|nr:arginine--tRNA ligase [Chloroflexota bacterium]